MWHTAAFKLVCTFSGCDEGKHVVCQVWSPGGSLLATRCSDGTATVWDVATGAVMLSVEDRAASNEGISGVDSISWSLDGHKFTTGSHRSPILGHPCAEYASD